MIAMLRLRAYRSHGVMAVPALPPVPPPCRALAAHCAGEAQLREVAAWLEAVRKHLPAFPAVLVVPRDAELLRLLVTLRVEVDGVRFADELPAPGVLSEAELDALWARTATAMLLDELLAMVPAPLSPRERTLLRRMVAMATAGKSVQALVRQMAISEPTLRRWMRDRGLPAPKQLFQVLRVAEVRRMVRSGGELEAAVRAAGWVDPRAFRAAERRATARKAVWVGKLLGEPAGAERECVGA